MAPVSGAIFACRKPIDDVNVCDKSAKPAISGKKPFAYWHIAYKNVARAHAARSKSALGEFLQYIGGGQRDLTWNRQCTPRPLAATALSPIHNWSKGADASPEGRSYNFSR